VNAKDVALALIRRMGVSAARGTAVEYCGPVVQAMNIESRMTLCNMTIEWGGRTCLIAPDEKTIAWCKGRRGAPQGQAWDEARAWWQTLHSDADAVFDEEHHLDCTDLSPQLTWGTDPAQAIGINEAVPQPMALGASAQERAARALAYMAVKAGQSLDGLTIDRVFIGSCSNARLPDLRTAARVVQGRQVAAGVQALVVPGSSTIKRQAEAEGLDQIFLQAGFEWHEAGCSMCAGANGDIGSPGQRCVATSNRNFENRQGRDVRTHLASPAMAAAAAIAGHLTDVRRLMETPA
jgi:3-isopropylmalate/(R)-2-methylmalate dehydratase large subunit